MFSEGTIIMRIIFTKIIISEDNVELFFLVGKHHKALKVPHKKITVSYVKSFFAKSILLQDAMC